MERFVTLCQFMIIQFSLKARVIFGGHFFCYLVIGRWETLLLPSVCLVTMDGVRFYSFLMYSELA